MTIQFTGLGSGMDYSSWIDALVAVKQEALTNIQTKIEKTEIEQTAIKNLRSEVSAFNSAITKFTDSNLLSAFDIFNRKKVSSSDEGKTASATVSNDATIQNFSLEVLQLATATVATGQNQLGKLAGIEGSYPITNFDTPLKDIYNGAITNGNISIQVGDQTKTFEITDNTTLQDFKDFLEKGLGVDGETTVTLDDNGKLSINIKNTVTNENQEKIDVLPVITIGNSSDTSNLLSFLGICGECNINTQKKDNYSGWGPSRTYVNTTHTSTITVNSNTELRIYNGMDATKLKDLNNGVVTEGDVSIYVKNGSGQLEKKIFTVNQTTTLEEFKDFLTSKNKYKDTGLGIAEENISYKNGKLSFTLNNDQDIKIGSTSDTSNLLDFFGFKSNGAEAPTPPTYSSDKILTTINITGKLVDNINLPTDISKSDITGSFKIGTETFTIDDKKSISALMYEINSNSDAGVTASYDAVANRLVLTAKEPGATTINIEAIGDCKFTDAVGWTNNGHLAEGSQNLGKNSIFKINDKEFVAASNAISEDVTGIAGLTLSLNKTSNGDPVQINITNDYTDVESAIDTFIEKYNKLITDIKTASSKDGDLAYDSGLRRMASELSNTIMNIVPGLDKYTCLSTVGISTGGARTDVSDVSQELVFDKSKFEEAMTKNPNEVKKLFVNLDKDDRSNNGVMTKLKDIVEGYTDKDDEWHPGYLDYNSGYFAIKSDSCSKRIETLNESLTRKQLLIEQYRARLEKQFQNMDNYVSQMSSYSNYLSSIGTNAAAQ